MTRKSSPNLPGILTIDAVGRSMIGIVTGMSTVGGVHAEPRAVPAEAGS